MYIKCVLNQTVDLNVNLIQYSFIQGKMFREYIEPLAVILVCKINQKQLQVTCLIAD